MTVDRLIGEWELLLTDMCFAGLKNAQPVLQKQLEGLRGWMEELGLSGGSALADGFLEALRAYQRGEEDVRRAADALCVLEFYCKNIGGDGGDGGDAGAGVEED